MKKDSKRDVVNRTSILYGLLFVATGIIINLAGSRIAVNLKLPLYLDSVGTILISLVGGSVPGVLVGFLSNIINGFFDRYNLYYAPISVLLAITTVILAGRGYFDKLWKALLLAIPFSLFGGVLGSAITFGLFGNGFGEGFSLPLALKFYDAGLSVFFSQMLADTLVDIVDKFVTILITWLIWKALKKVNQEDMSLHFWRQTPLSDKELKDIRSGSNSLTHQLRYRLGFIITTIVVIIFIAITWISYQLYSDVTLKEREQASVGVARLVASVIDGNKIDHYIEAGDTDEEYRNIEKKLKIIRETSDDILYVYVYKIMPDGCHVVFDLDTEDTPGGNPGDIVEFDQAFEPYLEDLLEGNRIDIIVSDETFGWLLTYYEPIRNMYGRTTAYACVDISMDEVKINQISYMTQVTTLFFGFFLTIIVIGLWLAEHYLVLPINTMSKAARQFAYDSEESRSYSQEKFNGLHISTGDEIENLYDSFEMTIGETLHYISETENKTKALNKMQNGLIMVLADMVESRDQNTGDHVRKTAAYCDIILKQLQKNGDYTDQINENFIADVVYSAPLHDIGKIKVSDTILNKPGKLTDEEFNEMKKHTLAGKDIIEQAMKQVSVDSSYLKEAQNLAAYHHEKWNGKGYPMGLSGEDIPLSARVMAVADVFDALVSKRSYKEPFTFEKAMEIIKEGSGNHFDPKVVQAFVDVQDQARAISEMFMGIDHDEVNEA